MKLKSTLRLYNATVVESAALAVAKSGAAAGFSFHGHHRKAKKEILAAIEAVKTLREALVLQMESIIQHDSDSRAFYRRSNIVKLAETTKKPKRKRGRPRKVAA